MRDSYEDSPAEARELGLRRLSRLTWRTAQIGALATVGFAIVFARTASAPAANVATVPSAEPPSATAAPSHGQPAASPQGIAGTQRATTRPSGQQATHSAKPTPTSAQAPAPSAKPTVAATHTLAPPTTAPKPAPTKSSPAPTATSTSHAGG